MSQAEELLNSLDNDMTITPNSDDDYIVVNQDRTISVPDSLRRLGVQHDHNIETVTFNCPRFWDGNDMSQMKIYINYMRPDGVKGRYLTGNLEVADDTMTFDWTISNNVTHVRGTLSFLICIVQTDEDGIEVQHWNSELNQECYISEGMECTESVVLGYPDVITHLLLQMEKMGPGGSGSSGIYILSEDETIADVPPGYDVVIDPYANNPDIPLTRGDIQEIVDEVLSALPTWTGGSY